MKNINMCAHGSHAGSWAIGADALRRSLALHVLAPCLACLQASLAFRPLLLAGLLTRDDAADLDVVRNVLHHFLLARLKCNKARREHHLLERLELSDGCVDDASHVWAQRTHTWTSVAAAATGCRTGKWQAAERASGRVQHVQLAGCSTCSWQAAARASGRLQKGQLAGWLQHVQLAGCRTGKWQAAGQASGRLQHGPWGYIAWTLWASSKLELAT
eukprot:364640-Chlamydomonas_euryale.AAC.28